MVEVVTSENAALYRDALHDMHKMRYRVAVKQWGWTIPGIEPGYDRDDFDTDDTIYFLCLDASETRALACARLNPTLKPHLLSEVFAERCVSESVPRSASIYELSRYIVDHQAMTKEEQFAVRGRIVSAVNKFCLKVGVTHVSFLCYMSSYARTVKYWKTRPLGAPCYFPEDDATYIAALSAMTDAGLQYLREGFGLSDSEPHLSSRLDWSVQPAAGRIRASIENQLSAA